MSKTMARTVLLAIVAGSPAWVPTANSADDLGFRAKLTFAEKAAQADAIAIAEKIGVDEQTQHTVCLIRHLRLFGNDQLKVGDKISVRWFRKDVGPGLQLLFAFREKHLQLEWSHDSPATDDTLKYIRGAPASDMVPAQRLPYFLQFLESSDPVIAEDAIFEMDLAHTNDFLACASKFPRDKLREWLKSPKTPVARRSLYVLMLGFCGEASDAEFMLDHIRQRTEDFRPEIEGYNIAYLWLAGEQGLDVLDKLTIQPRDVPFSELYGAMIALRFMGAYGTERIGKERLLQSYRPLLDRPEITDLVIGDLIRWQDWSMLDRVVGLYGQGEYNIPSVKRAIARFCLACGQVPGPKLSADKKETPLAELPPHAIKAREHLEELRQRDPTIVKDAERFWFLSGPSKYDPGRGRVARRGWGWGC